VPGHAEGSDQRAAQGDRGGQEALREPEGGEREALAADDDAQHGEDGASEADPESQIESRRAGTADRK